MSGSSNKKGSVLVVDDEKVFLDVLADEFKERGYKVWKASDGESAWQIVLKQSIDLVITDCRIPGFDGLRLLDAIRSLPQKPLVLLMTGFTEVSEKEMLERGASALLAKPFRLSDFMALAEKLLREKRGL